MNSGTVPTKRLPLVATAIAVVFLSIVLYIGWSIKIDAPGTIEYWLSSVVKFKKDAARIDLDFRQELMARFFGSHLRVNGNLALILYNLHITNMERAFTPKELLIRYRVKGQEHTTNSCPMQTGLINGQIKAIRVQMGSATVYLQQWQNIGDAITNAGLMQPGNAIGGSALFPLDLNSIDDLATLNSFDLIVTDYSGNETIQTFELTAEAKQMAKYSTVTNETFTQQSQ